MQVDCWSFLYARTLGLVCVISADHALRGLYHLPALNETNQPLLQLQVTETLFFVTHSQADHAQGPSRGQRLTLSLDTFVAAGSLAYLRKSHFCHGAVAGALVQQSDPQQSTGLDVDGYLDIDAWWKQGRNVQD